MKSKKNLIIVSMMAIVAVMAIGYSFFATRLNINATGNITSQWNVYFSNIAVGSTTGGASNKVTPSVTNTTANMSANLSIPGDSITYELTLTNAGTIGAIIEDIEAKAEGSSAIIYSISGLKIGDKLASGENKVITIKIEYDPNVTSQPSETSKTLTVNIDAVQDIGQNIESGDININEPTSLAASILKNNTVQSDDGIDFSKISSDTNGKGLYSTITDKGTVYYFRGDVENNYVQFGEHQEDNYTYYPVGYYNFGDWSTYEACMELIKTAGAPWTECKKVGPSKGDPIYWRIVRINEDGTIKLLYVGNSAQDEITRIKDSDSNEYLNSGNKTKLETWYTTNLENSYGSYVADNAFCSDNGVFKTETPISGAPQVIYYNAYSRAINYNPTFNCSTDYSLTVANGKLNKPIGLITADEIIYAGGVLNTVNTNSYLYTGYGYESMTIGVSDPANFTNLVPGYFGINEWGHTSISVLTGGFDVWLRPVINLKSTVEITDGDGTETNPYIIKNN